MKRQKINFDSIFVFVGNAELGARAVCSILLGMNVLDAKAPFHFLVFIIRERCTGAQAVFTFFFFLSL